MPMSPIIRGIQREGRFEGIDPDIIELLLSDLGMNFYYVDYKSKSSHPRIDVLKAG